MPAIPPIAADRAKDKRTIRLTLIPIRLAAVRLTAQAVIAFPIMVYLKKMDNNTTTTTVIPTTQMYWGLRDAPIKAIPFSPEKGGRKWVSFPHINMAIPLNRMETAMVTIIRVTTVGFFIGEMANLSMIMPTKVRITTVRRNPKIRGNLSIPVKNIMMSPPSITNSPWAKFMIEVEL
jgi:hypothetical protein